MFEDQVRDVLDEKVRPALAMDGGDCELVEADEASGTVKVRLRGACSGCPGAFYTLKHGIERILKEEVPAVKAVEAVPF